MSKFSLMPLLLILSLLNGCNTHKSLDACVLVEPPESAIVYTTHAMDFRIYPDNLSKDFSGCQKIWLEDDSLLALLKYKNGLVSYVELTEPEQKKVICKFNNTNLLDGPTDKCLPYDKWAIFNGNSKKD